MGIDPKKEQEFKNLVSQTRTQGQKIIQQSQSRSKEAQFIVDFADQTLNVTRYGIPPTIDLDRKLTAWKYVYLQQGQVIEATNVITTSTSSNSVAFFSTDLANPSNITPFVPPEKKDEIILSAHRLAQLIDRQADRSNVVALLDGLNLNTTIEDTQTPNELFKIAWEAHENPTTGSPAITSLIPMRECIEIVISILLQRRPSPVKAKNWFQKIQSILTQLVLDNIPSTAITDLSNSWVNLQHELSKSKQKEISREGCRDTLQRATLFLLELLQSIDKSKMNTRSGLVKD